MIKFLCQQFLATVDSDSCALNPHTDHKLKVLDIPVCNNYQASFDCLGRLRSSFKEISYFETSCGLKAIFDLKQGQHSKHLTTGKE